MSKSTRKQSAATSVSRPAGSVTYEGAHELLYVEVPGGRIAYDLMGSCCRDVKGSSAAFDALPSQRSERRGGRETAAGPTRERTCGDRRDYGRPGKRANVSPALHSPRRAHPIDVAASSAGTAQAR
jgi:hypothetical protein